MLNKIKSFDQFGHEVVLNFNSKGKFHFTLLGGIVSILVNIFVLVYICSLVQKHILYENDSL